MRETGGLGDGRRKPKRGNDRHVDERFAVTLVVRSLEPRNWPARSIDRSIDRWIIFKLAELERTFEPCELSLSASRMQTFPRRVPEEERRVGKRGRGRDVDRELVPSLRTYTHALSLSPLTLAFVSFARSSYDSRKMQRITIFFLSPFVHNVESTVRGSFSIFTRAV